MENVVSFWFQAIGDIISSYFNYEIVPGVYFGWFVIACFLMGIVIRYTYNKIVR